MSVPTLGQRLRRVLELTRHGGPERSVYLALDAFADDTGTCYLSWAEIAELAGVNIRSVGRALTSLRASGLVTSTRLYESRGVVGCRYVLTTFKAEPA